MPTKMRKNILLIQFLTKYILILIFPLVLSIIIQTKTVEMIKEDIKKSNLTMLEQTRDIIDSHIQALNSMIDRVALDPKINSLANISAIGEGSSDIDVLISAANSFTSYRIANSFVKEFFIYFRKSDIIMTSSAATTKMKLIYGDYFQFENMSYEEWVSSITTNIQTNSYIASSLAKFNGKISPVITRLQPIPLGYSKTNRGCIIAFIDANAMINLLQKINADGNGYTYILNKNNSIITSVCPDGKEAKKIDIAFDKNAGIMDARILGEDMVVSYTGSSLNGWRYVTAIPKSVVMRKADYIQKIFLTAAIVILILGAVLSVVFSYKNAKPIREIYNLLKDILGENSKYKNEYLYLSESINSLINNNRELRSKIDNQIPLIRDVFVRRLLNGGFKDMEEVDANMSHLSIQISGPFYVSVILKIISYKDLINKNVLRELDIIRLVIKNTINDKYGDKAICCDLDETRISILLSFDIKDRQMIENEVENIVQGVYDTLYSQLKVNVTFAAGSICNSLLDIGFSFVEAKHALGYISGEQTKKLVWYHQKSNLIDSYKYTTDMKTRLVDLVKSGDTEELEKFLKIIHLENFFRRKLPAPILRLLLYQLTGTLLDIAELLDLKSPEIISKEISQGDDMESVFYEICKYFREISESVSMKKEKSDDVLYDQLLGYVNKAYQDEALTLYSVAAHFNLKEAYLYHFFKVKAGMSFADYIEKLRIGHAYGLLTETGLTIKEIALKVGYGSEHSFRRAFKRYKGYLPSDIRNV